MSDKQIANWMSDGIQYTINKNIIDNNITDAKEIKQLYLNCYDEIIDGLESADKFKNNDLEARSCGGWKMLGCAAFTGLVAPCILMLPPAAAACIAGIVGAEAVGCLECWY